MRKQHIQEKERKKEEDKRLSKLPNEKDKKCLGKNWERRSKLEIYINDSKIFKNNWKKERKKEKRTGNLKIREKWVKWKSEFEKKKRKKNVWMKEKKKKKECKI